MILSQLIKSKLGNLNISTGIQIIDHLNNEEILKISPALTKKEVEILSLINNTKRKNEWLAGRIAAKKAFHNFCRKSGYSSNYDITILNSENRAPYIFEYPELELSITHSNDFAIAAISNDPIGIDLEKVSSGHSIIIKYFFTDNESEIILNESKNNGKQAESIIKYWTRKEAVSKYLKLGMKMNYKLLDTVNDHLTINNDTSKNIRLFSYKFDDYYLSIAI